MLNEPLAKKALELNPDGGLVQRAFELAWRDSLFQRFWLGPKSAQEAIRQREIAVAADSACFVAVIERQSRSVAGQAEISLQPGGAVEFGFWIAESFRRRGFATATLRLLVDWTEAHVDPVTMLLRVHADNQAGRETALKGGFTPVQTARPGSSEVVRYVRLRKDRRERG